jgi:hypothetical protein
MVTPASNSKLRMVLKTIGRTFAGNRRNDAIMAPRDHYWLSSAGLNLTLHRLERSRGFFPDADKSNPLVA